MSQLGSAQRDRDIHQAEYEELAGRQIDAIAPYLERLSQKVVEDDEAIRNETNETKRLRARLNLCVLDHARLPGRLIPSTPWLVDQSRQSSRIDDLAVGEEFCAQIMEVCRGKSQFQKDQIKTRELRKQVLAAKRGPRSDLQQACRMWRDSEDTLAIRCENQIRAEKEVLMNIVRPLLSVHEISTSGWLHPTTSSMSSGQDLSLVSAKQASKYDKIGSTRADDDWKADRSTQWLNVHKSRRELNRQLRGRVNLAANYPLALAGYLATYNAGTESEFNRKYAEQYGSSFEARQADSHEQIEIWRGRPGGKM